MTYCLLVVQNPPIRRLHYKEIFATMRGLQIRIQKSVVIAESCFRFYLSIWVMSRVTCVGFLARLGWLNTINWHISKKALIAHFRTKIHQNMRKRTWTVSNTSMCCIYETILQNKILKDVLVNLLNHAHWPDRCDCMITHVRWWHYRIQLIRHRIFGGYDLLVLTVRVRYFGCFAGLWVNLVTMKYQVDTTAHVLWPGDVY